MLPALYREGQYPYDVDAEVAAIWTVETPSELAEVLDYLEGVSSVVAVDTEADDIDPSSESAAGKGRLVTTQLAWIEDIEQYADVDAIVAAIRRDEVTIERVWIDCRDPEMVRLLKPWLEDDHPKVLHNVDFDKHIFRNHGICLDGIVGDTLYMSRLEYPERISHALDGGMGLVSKLLGEKRLTTKQALAVNKFKKDGSLGKAVEWYGMLNCVEDEEMRPFQQVYSTFDVLDTVRLYYVLVSKLGDWEWAGDSRGLLGYWEDTGCSYAVNTLHDMERQGVCVDPGIVEMLIEEYEAYRDSLDARLWRWAGCQINWNSPKQKSYLLFGPEGEAREFKDTKRRTDIVIVGKELPFNEDPPEDGDVEFFPSTDQSALQYILRCYVEEDGWVSEEDATAIKLLQERQKVEKLISGTLYPLQRNMRSRHASGLRDQGPYTYVHSNFSVGTRTGRLASNSPNLQNIPARSRMGRRIRHAFICEKGEVMLVCDYSQLELRILAYYAMVLFNDPSFWNVLKSGDVHQATADSLGIKRSAAKAINFGLAYGMSAFKLANDLGITEAEANDILDRFFRLYPGVKRYMDWAKAYAHENGAARTILGRYRQLPDINSRNRKYRSAAERRAMNTPIQGSAQDIVGTAMVALENDLELARYGFIMRLQVHDEIVATCKLEHREAALARMIEVMENAMPAETMAGVHFRVDGHWGHSWAEAKEGGMFTCPKCRGKGCDFCEDGELHDWKVAA